MPTNQPNDAAEEQVDLRDDATAAAVIADERLDQPPGANGFGGAAAADTAGPKPPRPDGAAMLTKSV